MFKLFGLAVALILAVAGSVDAGPFGGGCSGGQCSGGGRFVRQVVAAPVVAASNVVNRTVTRTREVVREVRPFQRIRNFFHRRGR